jgi:hypothetical protein
MENLKELLREELRIRLLTVPLFPRTLHSSPNIFGENDYVE